MLLWTKCLMEGDYWNFQGFFIILGIFGYMSCKVAPLISSKLIFLWDHGIRLCSFFKPLFTFIFYTRYQCRCCVYLGHPSICITFLHLYSILFFTLDLFAMTIDVASFSLKGSSYCNGRHPCHQLKMICQTWSLP